MSITPLNTIIMVTQNNGMKQHPLQNNSSKNAKCILPPFKIRSVVTAAAAALCPLKSHQCVCGWVNNKAGETILSSTHKNVFLSFIWLNISILQCLSLFSSSYTRFDLPCSTRLGDPLYFKKRVFSSSCDFLLFDGRRVDNDGKLSWNWIQLSRIDLILSVAERWKELY